MQYLRLREAFKDLRKAGYFARQNFTCCQSCAWAEIPEEKSDKVVFYHAQEAQTHPTCLLYTSPSPRDRQKSRMPSSA